ncbi:hypothetical protein QQ213_000350 [Vibrio vulnificus]|uniref:hypothetical protein n=1 Tax=Vibrio vulnificus TaxID=672 RepID=UPI0013EEAFEF|nr:hypothetical protein [Vibrio vulnificus]EKG2480707.1 hypothetical protein [Vibrio vulnificus]ELK2034456.1 hypothetical protein [Vibrio vulnificus]ELK2280235.1 hypothetical protein [Vibrio vulnificus]ELP6768938.1 hypothetical protein [Vibrio vulnificus]ELS0750623.1 hypothetical protein [Vibrio vulnificus]
MKAARLLIGTLFEGNYLVMKGAWHTCDRTKIRKIVNKLEFLLVLPNGNKIVFYLYRYVFNGLFDFEITVVRPKVFARLCEVIQN